MDIIEHTHQRLGEQMKKQLSMIISLKWIYLYLVFQGVAEYRFIYDSRPFSSASKKKKQQQPNDLFC